MTEINNKVYDEIFLEIVYIFILPVVLIYLGVINMEWRVLILFICALLISGIIRHQRWSKDKLGLVPINKQALFEYTLFTILGVLGLVLFARYFSFAPIDITDWNESWRLILFFIPLSVLQEIAYRGYLSARLRELFTSRAHRILINTGLFALLHIIYPLPALLLPIVIIGGLFFAWLYERHSNLVLISMSHSILNFTAVMFGFFS